MNLKPTRSRPSGPSAAIGDVAGVAAGILGGLSADRAATPRDYFWMYGINQDANVPPDRYHIPHLAGGRAAIAGSKGGMQ